VRDPLDEEAEEAGGMTVIIPLGIQRSRVTVG